MWKELLPVLPATLQFPAEQRSRFCILQLIVSAVRFHSHCAHQPSFPATTATVWHLPSKKTKQQTTESGEMAKISEHLAAKEPDYYLRR